MLFGQSHTCVSAVSTQGASSMDRWNNGTAVVTVMALLAPECSSPSSTPHTVQEGYLDACSKIVRYASSVSWYEDTMFSSLRF